MRQKIVIACDSFKGCLESGDVASAVAEGICRVMPDTEVAIMEVADGGEGTGHILTRLLGGEIVMSKVTDPLGRTIDSEYGIVPQTTGNTKRTAIIEMAQASGLTLLKENERNPLLTSTYGTGEMILDAMNKGCRRFLVGIGGSATNDGGTGMLEALGFRFRDSEGNEINGCCGGRLAEIKEIDVRPASKEILKSEFIVACDVNTPFCGEFGASKVFAAQKGADSSMIDTLEAGMKSLSKVILRHYGINLEEIPGSGAAGGLGGAFKAFLGAELKSGIDMVLDAAGFDNMIENASLVITGEGHIDTQSSRGKVIDGILKRCRKKDVPVMAIGGIVDNPEIACLSDTFGRHFFKTFQIGPRPENESDLEYAMRLEVARKNISDTVAKALKELSPSLFHANL
ncbi:MAG: glycerate kinase [Bacteroidales bacterium]|nr:glycerate kinase [Bacteroidales bacterium]